MRAATPAMTTNSGTPKPKSPIVVTVRLACRDGGWAARRPGAARREGRAATWARSGATERALLQLARGWPRDVVRSGTRDTTEDAITGGQE